MAKQKDNIRPVVSVFTPEVPPFGAKELTGDLIKKAEEVRLRGREARHDVPDSLDRLTFFSYLLFRKLPDGSRLEADWGGEDIQI